MAEAALADEWVINGDRIALQRRVLRLGKPPRRWKRPSWAAVALREPLEVRCLLCNMQVPVKGFGADALAYSHRGKTLTISKVLAQTSSMFFHMACVVMWWCKLLDQANASEHGLKVLPSFRCLRL